MDAASASAHCPINRLADEDLANIFKHLPPHVRLLVSEVSKRWYEISRIPWREIINLDLCPIPSENIGAVVKQCPNLRTLFASYKDFSLNQLHIFSRASLSSIKLYNCFCVIRAPEDEFIDLFSAVFSNNFVLAPLKEMVLCDFTIPAKFYPFDTDALPMSLQRLQLCVRFCPFDVARLRQLTCLTVCVSQEYDYSMDGLRDDFLSLQVLKSLRELCLSIHDDLYRSDPGTLALGLPQLEVLFLNDVRHELCDVELEKLTTKHPTLRVLCITGSLDENLTVPIRRRFPKGSDPLPLLHVFLGKQPSERITFTKSASDALEIHPITEPLPAFLEREEIAPLFEGVWIAAQIKEGAENGFSWWKYKGDTATSFRTANGT